MNNSGSYLKTNGHKLGLITHFLTISARSKEKLKEPRTVVFNSKVFLLFQAYLE